MTPSIHDPASLVDYAASLDCIHCGLCIPTCPTYRLTGVESSSPRGRIHLMRSVAEGELEPDAVFSDEMGFCLVCRNCESVCPAGVRFGKMMEVARDGLERREARPLLVRVVRRLGFRHVLPERTWLRVVGSLTRFAQVTGLLGVVARLAGERGAAMRALPTVPPASARALLPRRVEAVGEKRGEALVLEGCVMPELFPHVNHATVRSLAALGVECRTPKGLTCCGALHAHNGELELARDLARKAIEAVEGDDSTAPFVVNSAGCGAHLRELDQLFEESDPWHTRARAVAARVVDYSELVLPLVRDRELAAADLDSPVAWDAPCHLCHGQRVRTEPIQLLDAALGDAARRVPLEDEESCCGSAGIYSLLRPADSNAVLDERLDALERSGARTLVTANPGCHLQWRAGVQRRALPVRVLHLAEVVDRASTEPHQFSR